VRDETGKQGEQMNHSVISVYATVPREILNLTGHVIWCEHCGGTIAVGEIHKCRELWEDSK